MTQGAQFVGPLRGGSKCECGYSSMACHATNRVGHEKRVAERRRRIDSWQPQGGQL